MEIGLLEGTGKENHVQTNITYEDPKKVVFYRNKTETRTSYKIDLYLRPNYKKKKESRGISIKW